MKAIKIYTRGQAGDSYKNRKARALFHTVALTQGVAHSDSSISK